MKKLAVVAAIVAANIILICDTSSAADKSPRAAPPRVVVLDTTGFWRMHNQLSPPVVDSADGPKGVMLKSAWLDESTDAEKQGTFPYLGLLLVSFLVFLGRPTFLGRSRRPTMDLMRSMKLLTPAGRPV